jgi:hypothetical protein
LNAAPPARPPDSDDEEPADTLVSSSDDETGTMEQVAAKRARKDRRRQYRENLKNMRLQKKQIHERVHAAIFRCDDVLNDDLTALKEEASDVRQRVSQLVGAYQDLNEKSSKELVDIKSWFSLVQNDKDAKRDSKPSCDIEEFQAGVDSINEIVMSMSSCRESVEHKVCKLSELISV